MFVRRFPSLHPRAHVLLPGHRIDPSRTVRRASEPDQELAQSLDECLKHDKPPEHPITPRHLDLPSALVRETLMLPKHYDFRGKRLTPGFIAGLPLRGKSRIMAQPLSIRGGQP